MKLNFKGERILGVVAHPDDAELFCAGTLARAKRDGAAIGVCVMCRGDKGQPSEKVVNLAAARCKEMGLTKMDYAGVKLPEAEAIVKTCMITPIHEGMEEDYIRSVARGIRKVAKHYA